MKKKNKEYIRFLEKKINILENNICLLENIALTVNKSQINKIAELEDCLENKESNNREVENVVFDDKNKTVVVTFNNGEISVAKCAKGERYSKETGLAICIAKAALEDNSYKKFIKNWISKSESADEDKKLAKIYRNLNSPYYKRRVKAQKEWEKISESKRRSIKMRVNNGSL